MRVLVTGSGGFFGSRLVRVLTALGHEVTATSRQGGTIDAVTRVAMEAPLDARAYGTLIRQQRVEAVVNTLAAGVEPTDRDAQRLTDANAIFPAQLAQAASDAGATRLLHIGTSAEYASPVGAADRPMAEDGALVLDKLYGATKAAGTLLVLSTAAQMGLAAAVLRPFNLFGPGEKPYRLFPSLVERLKSGHPVPLSEGTQQRDFLFIDDACHATERMLRALDRPGAAGQAYNLASGTGRSVRDFALSIAKGVGADSGLLHFGAIAMRPDDLPYVVAATERLDRLIGPAHRTSIPDAIATTLAEADRCRT